MYVLVGPPLLAFDWLSWPVLNCFAHPLQGVVGIILPTIAITDGPGRWLIGLGD